MMQADTADTGKMSLRSNYAE